VLHQNKIIEAHLLWSCKGCSSLSRIKSLCYKSTLAQLRTQILLLGWNLLLGVVDYRTTMLIKLAKFNQSQHVKNICLLWFFSWSATRGIII